MDRNSGPTLCGECKKQVTSNSVRCTWCHKWIHQKCSGLSRSEIKQLAKIKSYAFECRSCTAARWPSPDQEPMEDGTEDNASVGSTLDPTSAYEQDEGAESRSRLKMKTSVLPVWTRHWIFCRLQSKIKQEGTHQELAQDEAR